MSFGIDCRFVGAGGCDDCVCVRAGFDVVGRRIGESQQNARNDDVQALSETNVRQHHFSRLALVTAQQLFPMAVVDIAQIDVEGA